MTHEVAQTVSSGAFSALDTLLGRVSAAYRAIESLSVRVSSCQNLHVHELRDTLDNAFLVQNDLEAWNSQLATREPHGELELMDDLTPASPIYFASKACMFQDVRAACGWLTCWSSRIILFRALLKGLALAFETGLLYEAPLSSEDIVEGMLATANAVCFSVPFMLGDIDSEGKSLAATTTKALGPYFMTRFLDILNTVPYLSKQQRLWTFECLLKISCRWGIGSALSVRRKWMQVYLLQATPEAPSVPM
jgi:hypothetical protein